MATLPAATLELQIHGYIATPFSHGIPRLYLHKPLAWKSSSSSTTNTTACCRCSSNLTITNHAQHSSSSSSLEHFPSSPLCYLVASSSSCTSPDDFSVPELRSSFDKCLLHPDYDSIREECDEWLLSGGASPSAKPKQRQALVESLLPLLVCRMIPFPEASRSRLVLVSKILTWMTLDDDDLDNPEALGSDVAAYVNRVDQISAVVADFGPGNGTHSAAAASSSRDETILLKSLRHIWSSISSVMSPRLYSRFLASFLDHLRAANLQSLLRSRRLLPADYDSYAAIRRASSAFSILFPLAEYAMGTELDEETHAHPLVEELRQAAMDHMWVCNDLVSCKVELAEGDRFNLPSVLFNGCGGHGSFQEAVDAAARIAHELDSRCVQLSEAILCGRSDQDHKAGGGMVLGSLPKAAGYATLITTCAAGMLSWSLQSGRYRYRHPSA